MNIETNEQIHIDTHKQRTKETTNQINTTKYINKETKKRISNKLNKQINHYTHNQ